MKNHGGPAFPVAFDELVMGAGAGALLTRRAVLSGMSLRDYFAGQTIATLLAQETKLNPEDAVTVAALTAYEIADAMLKARE